MNPIVRIMKRYINMPLKKALPLLFICVLVFAATAGCTSSSNTARATTTPTAAPTPTLLAVDNLIGAINELYKKENYTLSTPFTMTKQSDTITYHGVIVTAPTPATTIITPIGTSEVSTTKQARPSSTYDVTIVLTSGSTVDGVYNDARANLKNKHKPLYVTEGGRTGPPLSSYELGVSTVGGSYEIDNFGLTEDGAVLAGDTLGHFTYLSNADMNDMNEVLIVEQL